MAKNTFKFISQSYVFNTLQIMQKNGALCDLELVADDNERVFVHSLIWMAAFEDVDSFKGKGDRFQLSLKQLDIPGVDGDSLRAIVAFIYGKEIEVDRHVNVLDVLQRLGVKGSQINFRTNDAWLDNEHRDNLGCMEENDECESGDHLGIDEQHFKPNDGVSENLHNHVKIQTDCSSVSTGDVTVKVEFNLPAQPDDNDVTSDSISGNTPQKLPAEQFSTFDLDNSSSNQIDFSIVKTEPTSPTYYECVGAYDSNGVSNFISENRASSRKESKLTNGLLNQNSESITLAPVTLKRTKSGNKDESGLQDSRHYRTKTKRKKSGSRQADSVEIVTLAAFVPVSDDASGKFRRIVPKLAGMPINSTNFQSESLYMDKTPQSSELESFHSDFESCTPSNIKPVGLFKNSAHRNLTNSSDSAPTKLTEQMENTSTKLLDFKDKATKRKQQLNTSVNTVSDKTNFRRRRGRPRMNKISALVNRVEPVCALPDTNVIQEAEANTTAYLKEIQCENSKERENPGPASEAGSHSINVQTNLKRKRGRPKKDRKSALTNVVKSRRIIAKPAFITGSQVVACDKSKKILMKKWTNSLRKQDKKSNVFKIQPAMEPDSDSKKLGSFKFTGESVMQTPMIGSLDSNSEKPTLSPSPNSVKTVTSNHINTTVQSQLSNQQNVCVSNLKSDQNKSGINLNMQLSGSPVIPHVKSPSNCVVPDGQSTVPITQVLQPVTQYVQTQNLIPQSYGFQTFQLVQGQGVGVASLVANSIPSGPIYVQNQSQSNPYLSNHQTGQNQPFNQTLSTQVQDLNQSTLGKNNSTVQSHTLLLQKQTLSTVQNVQNCNIMPIPANPSQVVYMPYQETKTDNYMIKKTSKKIEKFASLASQQIAESKVKESRILKDKSKSLGKHTALSSGIALHDASNKQHNDYEIVSVSTNSSKERNHEHEASDERTDKTSIGQKHSNLEHLAKNIIDTTDSSKTKYFNAYQTSLQNLQNSRVFREIAPKKS